MQSNCIQGYLHELLSICEIYKKYAPVNILLCDNSCWLNYNLHLLHLSYMNASPLIYTSTITTEKCHQLRLKYSTSNYIFKTIEMFKDEPFNIADLLLTNFMPETFKITFFRVEP